MLDKLDTKYHFYYYYFYGLLLLLLLLLLLPLLLLRPVLGFSNDFFVSARIVLDRLFHCERCQDTLQDGAPQKDENATELLYC